MKTSNSSTLDKWQWLLFDLMQCAFKGFNFDLLPVIGIGNAYKEEKYFLLVPPPSSSRMNLTSQVIPVDTAIIYLTSSLIKNQPYTVTCHWCQLTTLGWRKLYGQQGNVSHFIWSPQYYMHIESDPIFFVQYQDIRLGDKLNLPWKLSLYMVTIGCHEFWSYNLQNDINKLSKGFTGVI